MSNNLEKTGYIAGMGNESDLQQLAIGSESAILKLPSEGRIGNAHWTK
jgi:hypothetical protein